MDRLLSNTTGPASYLSVLLALWAAAGCAVGVDSPPGETYRRPAATPDSSGPVSDTGAFVASGIASWYGGKFHGQLTASGETFNKWDHTAAHRTLPLGTRLVVERIETGQRVVVRVNDRGPFVENRIIDLSRGAASELGIVAKGTAPVRLYRVGSDSPTRSPPCPGHLTVQAGSFEQSDNAKRLRTRLEAHFSEVFITRQGPYHRVRVGRFEGREDAWEAADRLEEMGFETWIVRGSD